VRYLLLFFSLLTTAVCGCDGAQRGQFAVIGSSSRSFSGIPGSLTIVRGQPQPLTAQGGGEQPLLYILVLAPSITPSGSGSTSENGAYVSTYKNVWDTGQGKVTVGLSWDRRTDKVSAGGATFDRQKGNVFVLVRAPSGAVAVTQSGPLNASLDAFAALPQIQAALPANSPAKTVTLAR
jgi:hypothetical protein